MDPEIKAFVAALERRLTAEDLASLDACIDCQYCAESCTWFLSSYDPALRPTFKSHFIADLFHRFLTLQGKLRGGIGLAHRYTAQDLREHMDAYWKCSTCGLCTLSCPAGIDMSRIVRAARAAYVEAGLAAENPALQAIAERVEHRLGVDAASDDAARFALGWTEQGVDVPVAVRGAEGLLLLPASLPDCGTKLLRVLSAAGVSYTVSPRAVDSDAEIDEVVVDRALSKRLFENWEAEAAWLGCAELLALDAPTLARDAAEMLGRPFALPLVDVDELLLRLIESGRLAVEPGGERVTLHDPCHTPHRAGDTARALLAHVASDVVEMRPNREHSYCCGGGAGGLSLPENAELRRRASSFKAAQIRATGARFVVTSRAVCARALDDAGVAHGLAAPGERVSRLLFELVHDAMLRALAHRAAGSAGG
ncbi:MAG: (Fe-S)-binding protein [Candidatus Baltobacteraceae bacterium]